MNEPQKSESDPMQELAELAGERVGGAALACSDDFFAEKENLLRAAAPVFIDGKYTDRGKWMDGWESRRRRIEALPDPNHDWCVVRLGMPGVVHGVDVDTRFFRGNFPEFARIEGCSLDGDPDAARVLASDVEWLEVVPKHALRGDSSNLLRAHASLVEARRRFTHLRLSIFPDGGVARLRVYGEVVAEWAKIKRFGGLVDVAAIEHGGVVVACNDAFFGSRHNLIMPGRSINMGDGWETRRKRRAGHDWSIVKLGHRGVVKRVEIDTNWFKGNFPESAWLDVCDASDAKVDEHTHELVDVAWRPLLARTKLRGHTRHFFSTGDGEGLLDAGHATHVRLSIHPDGGVSRLRVHAELAP